MLVRCPKNFANKSGANKKCKIIWVNSDWLLQTPAQTPPLSQDQSLRRVYAYLPDTSSPPCHAPLKRGETLCNVTFRIFSFDFKFAKVARCQLSWKYCKLRQSHVQVYRHLALPARQPQRGANARATDNCSVANFVALLRCQLKAEPPKLTFQHWRAIK